MSHARGRAVTGGLVLAASALLSAVIPAAAATAAVPAAVPKAPTIAGSCSPLQDGEIRTTYRGDRYICKYEGGLGGFYWVLLPKNYCGAATSPAVKATRRC
jgi:hypothetical protein